MDYSCHAREEEGAKESQSESNKDERAYIEPNSNEGKMVFKMPLVFGKSKVLKQNVLEEPLNMTKQKLDETEELCDSSQKDFKKTELPYCEPNWAGIPEQSYCFEVLKNGVILSVIDISDRSLTVFGRLGTSDVTLEHPSVSRYHAVVQYRHLEDENNSKGFYVYDLESTHGTFLNKEKLQPRTYYRLHVGHMLKFGGSSRMYILQGPSNDEEKELDFTVTELKEMRRQHEEKLNMLEEKEQKLEQQEPQENEGIDWGMGEDAIEDPCAENPFALSTPNEDLYLDDPKKTLRGWFEREGYDLEYDVEEKGFGQFLCKVQLPIDTPNGEYVYAEACIRGKKKEAVAACALEACRILDRYGLLRQAQHESRKRKRKNWEEDDYYDSDEDTYLDRTGTIEKKRELRKRMFNKEQAAETYDSLVKKLKEVEQEMEEINAKLQKGKVAANMKLPEQSEDDLDTYMSTIQMGAIDKKTQSKLQFHLNHLQQEQRRLQKLVDIARPVSLPSFERQPTASSEKISGSKKNYSLLTGAMKGHPLNKTKKMPPPVQAPPETKPIANDGEGVEEEVEDDDEDDENKPSDLSSSTEEKEIPVTESEAVEELKDSTTVQQKNVPEDVQPTPSDVTEHISTKGPQWPPPEDLSNSQSTQKADENKKKSTEKTSKDKQDVYDGTDPEYAMWLPPNDQSGDGRTHLNAKFGY